MSLQTSIDRIHPETAVITFVGNLTLGMNLKMVDGQIQGLVEEGVSRMVLDLTAVPYIDSAGLGMLVHTRGLMRQREGKLRLCGVSEQVASLLKMTMMDEVLPVDADTTASLAALGSAG
jgi:anti-sigma B factor antagonist